MFHVVLAQCAVAVHGAARAPIRTWDSGQWSGKQPRAQDEAAPVRTAGRSRAAKRSAFYDALRAYNDHFVPLITSEWKAEQLAITTQIQQWPRSRLLSEGLLLAGLEARRLSRDFYGEPIIQLSLRSTGGPESAAPPLPFHRFAVGDVVTLCDGDEPALPPSLTGFDARNTAAEAKGEAGAATEGVVLQRTSTQLLIVSRAVPEALLPRAAPADGRAVPRGGRGRAFPFCLSLGASAVPYERCRAALDALCEPDASEALLCPELRRLIACSDGCGTAGAGGDGSELLGRDDLAAISATAPSFVGFGAEAGGAAAARAAAKVALRQPEMAALLARLNPAQSQVIRTALARRLTLIQGPPGTGKTRTACALLAAAVELHAALETTPNGGGGSPVLAVASSNVAADELLAGLMALGLRVVRVGQPASVRESLRNATLDARLERSPAVLAAREALAAAQGRGNPTDVAAAFNAMRRVETALAVRALLGAQVVVASCVGAGRIVELVTASASTAAGDGGGGGGGGGGRGGRGGGGGTGARGGGVVRGGARGRGRARGSARGGRGSARSEALAPTVLAAESAPPAPPLRFRSVLIDEATQSTEPASLVPLLYGASQLFLVGDSQQLPPTVTDVGAARAGLATSLFERLQRCGLEPLLLDTQYRMHPAIAAFPSAQFYANRLISAVSPEDRPRPAGLAWPSPQSPIAFVSLAGGERRKVLSAVGEGTLPEAAAALPLGSEAEGEGAAEDEDGSEGGSGGEGGGGSEGSGASSDGATSYSNAREASAIASIAASLLANGMAACDIGVLTPYAAQALVLQQALAAMDAKARRGRPPGPPGPPGCAAIEVSSVDGFQGREKEVILFSAVRSNAARRVGFLSDARRLNVALTRARSGLVLVGDDATLGADPNWRAYLSFLRRRGCVVRSVEELLQLPDGGGASENTEIQIEE